MNQTNTTNEKMNDEPQPLLKDDIPKEDEINLYILECDKIETQDIEIHPSLKPTEQESISTYEPEQYESNYLSPTKLQIPLTDKFSSSPYDIERESDWLLIEKFPSRSSTELKFCISKLLTLYTKYNNVFYISTYYQFEYTKFNLTYDDVYNILSIYHDEYIHFIEYKKHIINQFDYLGKYFTEDQKQKFIDEYIECKTSLHDLNKVNDYLSYIKELNKDDITNIQLQKIISLQCVSVIPSIIERNKKAKIDKFINSYVLDVNDVINNLKIINEKNSYENLIRPPIPKIQPVVLASQYINEVLDQEVKVLTQGCILYSILLSAHPYIKNMLYEEYKENSFVNTFPTLKGESELNIYHPSFRCKRIKNRPIISFLNASDNEGDLYIDIEKCVDSELIEMNINTIFPQDKYSEICRKLSSALNGFDIKQTSEEHNDGYILMRDESVRIIIMEIQQKNFVNIIKRELHNKAEEYIINKATRKFEDIISLNAYNIYEYIISFLYEPESSIVYCTTLNKDGIVIDSNFFEVLMQKKKIILKDDNSKKSLIEEEEKLKTILNDIGENLQEVLIVISANHFKSIKLKEKIHSLIPNSIKEKFSFQYCNILIPKIYALSDFVYAENKNMNTNIPSDKLFHFFTTISEGRLMQNPLAEICHLWHSKSKKELLKILNLHHLIECISQQKIIHLIESIMFKYITIRGVDFTKCISLNHYINMIAFVLFNRIKGKEEEEEIEKMRNCKSKVDIKKFLLKESFDIYNGFILFNNSNDLLDKTRININHYTIVNEIIKVLFPNGDISLILNELLIKKTKEIPNVLLSYDNTEFNNFVNSSPELQNNREIVMFILNELAQREKIIHKREISKEEMLLLMTGDDTIKNGVLRKAKVIKKNYDTNEFKCKINPSSTMNIIAYLKESEVDQSDIDLFCEGYEFVCKIKSIILSESAIAKPKIEITVKRNSLYDIKAYYFPNNIEDHFPFFEFIPQEDFSFADIIPPPYKLKYRKYQGDRVSIMRFKNITYEDCLSYIFLKEVYLFRPSYKGYNYITLSIKLRSIFWHIQIEQIDINEENPIVLGKKFIFDNIEYNGFREICQNYITPVLRYMNIAFAFRKFAHFESMEDMEDKLENEYKNSNRISYYFTILNEYPQYIILGYFIKESVFECEYIKVTNKGFCFHNKTFQDIDSIVLYFKKNYGNSEYYDYLIQVKRPKNCINQLIMDRKYNAFEGKDPNINIKCVLCKEFGHLREDCPRLDRRIGIKRRREDENVRNIRSDWRVVANREYYYWDVKENKNNKKEKGKEVWGYQTNANYNTNNNSNNNNGDWWNKNGNVWVNNSQDNEMIISKDNNNNDINHGWGIQENDDTDSSKKDNVDSDNNQKQSSNKNNKKEEENSCGSKQNGDIYQKDDNKEKSELNEQNSNNNQQTNNNQNPLNNNNSNIVNLNSSDDNKINSNQQTNLNSANDNISKDSMNIIDINEDNQKTSINTEDSNVNNQQSEKDNNDVNQNLWGKERNKSNWANDNNQNDSWWKLNTTNEQWSWGDDNNNQISWGNNSKGDLNSSNNQAKESESSNNYRKNNRNFRGRENGRFYDRGNRGRGYRGRKRDNYQRNSYNNNGWTLKENSNSWADNNSLPGWEIKDSKETNNTNNNNNNEQIDVPITMNNNTNNNCLDNNNNQINSCNNDKIEGRLEIKQSEMNLEIESSNTGNNINNNNNVNDIKSKDIESSNIKCSKENNTNNNKNNNQHIFENNNKLLFDSSNSEIKNKIKTCFNCGETDHKFKDCPKQIKCYKCKCEGHMSSNCPNQTSDKNTIKKPLICYNCGEKGHGSRNCTKPKQPKKVLTCFNCGEVGHTSRVCKNPRKEKSTIKNSLFNGIGNQMSFPNENEGKDTTNIGWGKFCISLEKDEGKGKDCKKEKEERKDDEDKKYLEDVEIIIIEGNNNKNSNNDSDSDNKDNNDSDND